MRLQMAQADTEPQPRWQVGAFAVAFVLAAPGLPAEAGAAPADCT